MDGGFKRAWCLLLSVITLSFGVSLREVEESALKHYYEIQIQELEVEKKHQEHLKELGSFFPVLNLEASFNLSKKQSFTFQIPPAPPREFVFVKGSYPKFTLQLVQNLFNLPDIRRYEISKRLESSQRYLLEEKKNEVLYRVREAYISALKARSAVEIYRKHLERVRAHLKDVEELYKQGIVAYKDLLETKVKLFEVREKLSSAEANYRKALNYLSYLSGVNVDEVEEIQDLPEMDLDYEKLLSELENRPILRYSKESVILSKKAVELSRSYLYPRATFEAIYLRTEESDLFPKDRYFLSFVLRWNIFSGFRRFRAIEEAKIEHLKAVKRHRDLEEKLRLELRNLLEEIEAAKVKIELAEKQLEDAKEHLRIAVEKYRAGLGTNTEVLDAQSYLKTAEETLQMSRYELALKIFKLKEVIGSE